MSPRSKESNKKPTVVENTADAGAATVAAHREPGTEAQRSLSLAEQRALLLLPVHDADTIKSYVKPHEGFARVAPLSLKRLSSYPDIASALRLDLPGLSAELLRSSELGEQEDIAYRLYRRALENRLSIESEVFRALLKLNRFLQSSEDEELQRDFADLAEWVAARTESARRRPPASPEEHPDPATEPAEPAEPKPE